MELELTIENTGVAPIYDRLPLIFSLKNDKKTQEFITVVDITEWMPGITVEKITLPVKTLSSGNYELGLAIKNAYTEVYLENDIDYSDGFYKLCNVKI